MSFLAAIIGRPNVGKSTLFNRLAGQKIAIVDDQPGVTRDRRLHAGRLFDLRFSIMDTAGFEEAAPESLAGRMRAQTEEGIRQADILFFMFDVRAGVTPLDQAFAAVARKSGKPVVLIANKAEARDAEYAAAESWSLGLGAPILMSAEHGLGLDDLRDAIEDAFGGEIPEEPEQPAGDEALTDVDVIDDPDEEDTDHVPLRPEELDPSRPLRIAIVGRPNVGKSTLINTIIQEDRLLTGPEAGITRDSIAVDWMWRDQPVKLFDTAGMRRRARVQEKVERLSVGETLRAIRFAEIVIILIDVTQPFDKQDLQITDLVVREGRTPVLAYNKFDLVEDRQQKLAELREMTDRLLPQIRGVRAVPLSGETGYGIDKLMESVREAYLRWNTRIPTARLNRWMEGILVRHPPPAVSGRRLKIKYVTQVKTRPPGFMLSCTRPDALPTSYTRYLTNALRETFDLAGIPIRIMVRSGENPYAGRARKR